jgi:hypothetical protein
MTRSGIHAHKFIDKAFDFNIVKNTFNGEKLIVHNWDILFKKKENIMFSKIMSNTLFYDGSATDIYKRYCERKQKYQNRGFELTNIDTFEENINNATCILEKTKKENTEKIANSGYIRGYNGLLFKNSKTGAYFGADYCGYLVLYEDNIFF